MDKENNQLVDKNVKVSSLFKSQKKTISFIIVVLIIVIVCVGIIAGYNYLFGSSENNSDSDTKNNVTGGSEQEYNFSSLETMSLEVEGKNIVFPTILKQLLDFGFEYPDGFDSGDLDNASTIVINKLIILRLLYNKTDGNSYGILTVTVDYDKDKEVSAFDSPIISYEFDWRYLADDGKPKMYEYMSLGGIKHGMSIEAIKEYYKEFATDIDNGIRIEKTNVVVNGTEVKKIYLDIYGGENEMAPFVKAMSLNLEF